MNKDDNKKALKKFNKDDIKPWMTKYESTSRTLFRGCWFFDFLYTVFQGIYEKREDKMSKIAQGAYTFGLAPHHGFMLKKIAGVAMNAIKRKDKFIAGLIEEQSKVQNV